MKRCIVCIVLITLILLLTGCSSVANSSNSKLTIEPYTLSEQESLLISKTGVDQIDYFNLTGSLQEDFDLQFSVEAYEYGEFKEVLLSTSDEPIGSFKDILISFGISNIDEVEDHFLKIVFGTPSALISTSYFDNMSARSISMLIDEKVTLENNEPIYLVAWIGTTENSLRSVGSENGELPENIEEAELALLFKVLLTDDKND